MNYVLVSAEEAMQMVGKSGKVLVAIQDLTKTKNNSVIKFTKKRGLECEKLIKEAETIGRIYDDFINQLRLFTNKQYDIINFENKGKLTTILLQE